jgi:hypothetical protein
MLPGIKTSRTNKNAVRAKAYILSETSLDKKANTILEVVMQRLDDQIKSLKDETTAVTKAIKEKVTEIADTLKAQIATVVETMTEEIKAATQGMNNTSKKLAEMTTKSRDTLVRPTTMGQAGAPPTTIINPKLRAREWVRLRQILIDFKVTDGPEIFKHGTIEMLKGKANKAIMESSRITKSRQ